MLAHHARSLVLFHLVIATAVHGGIRTTNSVQIEGSATGLVEYYEYDAEGNYTWTRAYLTDRISLTRTDPLPIQESIFVTPNNAVQGGQYADAFVNLRLDIAGISSFNLDAEVNPGAGWGGYAEALGLIIGTTTIDITNSPAYFSSNGGGDLFLLLRKSGENEDLIRIYREVMLSNDRWPVNNYILTPGKYELNWVLNGRESGQTNYDGYSSLQVSIVPEASSKVLMIAASTFIFLLSRRTVFSCRR